ncbi:MAG: RelA/SpoT family protein [Prevotella sp.]|nr:RelA/SpoT family protein [Prevotella sp.]
MDETNIFDAAELEELASLREFLRAQFADGAKGELGDEAKGNLDDGAKGNLGDEAKGELSDKASHNLGDGASEEFAALDRLIVRAMGNGGIERDAFGLHPLLLGLQTARVAAEEAGVGREAVAAEVVYSASGKDGQPSIDEIEATFGKQTAAIVRGLRKVRELYAITPAVKTENFRNLLLTFAEDMRVVLIMIADRVNIMRQIRDTENVEGQHKVAEEAAYLYAPLAHKLGLYRLKSELEDLSLKYLEHDAYYEIREDLNATKAARDAYIDAFIAPVKAELEKYGLKFHIKGRTKSIHSIWQKMKKQQCGFAGIYDLFAIRIILAAPPDREKMVCWQTFSIITNMYQSNPKRMRDWLSVPKSNGYESLHITVLGPERKWVEVQIRTERMDEIAENGIAAHWRYKGVKGDSGLDTWLADIRQALEAGDDMDAMNQFKLNLYEKEVYVFSPKGDLFKLAKGATVLDFAYYIHSNVGNRCVGAKINGRIVSIKEKLHSGDQVEILTQSNQTPKQDWLGIVKTPRAKSKLRLALKESLMKETAMAKELIERRLKNRKIDLDEATMAHVVNKMGYKVASDFYMDIARGRLEANAVIDKYLEVRNFDLGLNAVQAAHSAEEFTFDQAAACQLPRDDGDVLVIDKNLKGVDYSLAKCCNPIYGDDIFGFVTVNKGIKIHRSDCPNAAGMRARFGYRIVKARWSGKGASQYAVTIRVIGNDDIGIVNNITSIISKEERTIIRSINIDSNDGLFSGVIVLMVSDTTKMNQLIKKIGTVKGVRRVERI